MIALFCKHTTILLTIIQKFIFDNVSNCIFEISKLLNLIRLVNAEVFKF